MAVEACLICEPSYCELADSLNKFGESNRKRQKPAALCIGYKATHKIKNELQFHKISKINCFIM